MGRAHTSAEVQAAGMEAAARAGARARTHTAAPRARVGVSAAPTARPVNVCTGAFYDTASKRTLSLGYVCWLA